MRKEKSKRDKKEKGIKEKWSFGISFHCEKKKILKLAR